MSADDIYHDIIHLLEVLLMTTGKVFMTGRSQAVRLPKEYRFDDDEVILNKIGDVLIVIPKNKAKEIFLSSLDQFSDDYMSDGRNQPSQQEREFF